MSKLPQGARLSPRSPKFLLLGTLAAPLLLSASPAFALDQSKTPAEQNLKHIVKETMRIYFAEPDGAEAIRAYLRVLKTRPDFCKPAGVFVTLSRGGKTRGCWGSIYPQHESIAKSTVYATLGALTKEYRYKPIQPDEVKFLKPQVTVIRKIDPVSGIGSINPFRDGLMVRCGGRSAVILPGEAADAHHELVMAKLKAGIAPKEQCQIYKLKADIYD